MHFDSLNCMLLFFFLWVQLEYEIEQLSRISGHKKILRVCQLMLRADQARTRHMLIDILLEADHIAYLRLFLDYHGLKLIWGWMVEAKDEAIKFAILKLLKALPITNKTILMDSKVLPAVERWSLSDSTEWKQLVEFESSDGIDSQEEILKDHVQPRVEPPPPSSADTVVTEMVALNDDDELFFVNLTSNHETQRKIPLGALALRLMDAWKDLKEVFRIPKLAREKRQKDEQEADKKAKEDESKINRSMPRSFVSSSSSSYRSTFQRGATGYGKYEPTFSVSGDDGVSVLDQELRRKELEVRRTELELRRKTKELEFIEGKVEKSKRIYDQYNEFNPINKLVDPLNFGLANVLANTFPNSHSNPLESFQYFLNSQVNSSQATFTPATAATAAAAVVDMLNDDGMNQEDSLISDDVMVDEAIISSSSSLFPIAHFPSCIDLTESHQLEDDGHIPPGAIDNVDIGQMQFKCDQAWFSGMDKEMYDEIYPQAGVYYITPCGKTYFVNAATDDDSEPIMVNEGVVAPRLDLLAPERSSSSSPPPVLPYPWQVAEDCMTGHHYYFNSITRTSQWHPPIDYQIDFYADEHLVKHLLSNRHKHHHHDGGNTVIEVDHVSHVVVTPSSSSSSSELSHSSKSRKPSNQPAARNGAHSSAQTSKVNKLIQATFHEKVSQTIIKCLKPYMKRTCTQGRIKSSSEFKDLARKVREFCFSVFNFVLISSSFGRSLIVDSQSGEQRAKASETFRFGLHRFHQGQD